MSAFPRCGVESCKHNSYGMRLRAKSGRHHVHKLKPSSGLLASRKVPNGLWTPSGRTLAEATAEAARAPAIESGRKRAPVGLGVYVESGLGVQLWDVV